MCSVPVFTLRLKVLPVEGFVCQTGTDSSTLLPEVRKVPYEMRSTTAMHDPP